MKIEYFQWLVERVTDENSPTVYFSKCLSFLYDKDFRYLIDRDVNRSGDGLSLRREFCKEMGYVYIPTQFNQAVSVLEVMVAIALRCETEIMVEDPEDPHPARWFWDMFSSLGLGQYDDEVFDPVPVDDILERFLNREFEPNGAGSLFTIVNPLCDYRDMEIAGQMYHYLNEIIEAQ